ncbi:MAG: DUF2240 family protein [Thermoplasmatota archaeon]
MSTEEKIIVSFIFKRSGKNNLKESEIYLPLSLELGWFSLEQAKIFIKECIQEKILIKKNEKLTPSFDIEKISIPTGFNPISQQSREKKIDIKEHASNTFSDYVEYISKKSGKKSEDILDEIIQQKKEKNIMEEVAALYIANKYGVDSSFFYNSIENQFFRGNKE